MKLINPKKVRQMFAEKRNWLTINEIAAGAAVSNKTVSNALMGQPMYPKTVKRFAELLEVEATEIATFITN